MSLIGVIKRILRNVILKILPIEVIENLIIEGKVQKSNAVVTLGKTSKFYEEAKVFNFGNNKLNIKIGEGTHIRGELLIFPYGGKIQIGDNCYIGEGTRIWSGDQIIIGNNVLIAHNVNVMDFAHEKNSVDRAEGFKNLVKYGHPKEKGKITTANINIEDDVAIYAGVHVMMGVRIGKGSVISAGCVITRDVAPFSLMAGNPGKMVWKLK